MYATDHSAGVAPVTVVAGDRSLATNAAALAGQLGVALGDGDSVSTPWRLRLEPSSEAPGYVLTLQHSAAASEGPVSVEFVYGRAAHRRQFGGGRGQPLARAVGLKHGATPDVVDATAGFGRDALVLAQMGCRVRLLERSAVIAALLDNALQRALCQRDTTEIAARMTLIRGDARDYLANLTPDERPQVVYLDPMYPHRNKSALVKKEMRALRALVGGDDDAAELLRTALSCATRRVVVKRPRTAAALAGPTPSAAIAGKNTRYDIYVIGGVAAHVTTTG